MSEIDHLLPAWEALLAGDNIPGAGSIWRHQQGAYVVVLAIAISPDDQAPRVIVRRNRSGITEAVKLTDWRGKYERFDG